MGRRVSYEGGGPHIPLSHMEIMTIPIIHLIWSWSFFGAHACRGYLLGKNWAGIWALPIQGMWIVWCSRVRSNYIVAQQEDLFHWYLDFWNNHLYFTTQISEKYRRAICLVTVLTHRALLKFKLWFQWSLRYLRFIIMKRVDKSLSKSHKARYTSM